MKQTTTARRWSRGVLIGPVVFMTSAAVMAGGALWVPKGAASIDNIVLPIVFFPAIWAALFFHACLDRSLWRAWLLNVSLLLGNGLAITLQFMAQGAS